MLIFDKVEFLLKTFALKLIAEISGLVRNLEEEVKMNEYIASEKLPKEIEAKKKEVEILSRIANAPPPSSEALEILRQKVSDAS